MLIVEHREGHLGRRRPCHALVAPHPDDVIVDGEHQGEPVYIVDHGEMLDLGVAETRFGAEETVVARFR